MTACARERRLESLNSLRICAPAQPSPPTPTAHLVPGLQQTEKGSRQGLCGTAGDEDLRLPVQGKPGVPLAVRRQRLPHLGQASHGRVLVASVDCKPTVWEV